MPPRLPRSSEPLEKQLLESDAVTDPEGYQNLHDKLQLIKYKIALAGAS